MALKVTRLTLHIDLSDAMLRSIAKVHDVEADARGRATQEAVIDCLSNELSEWLDGTMMEAAERRKKR